MTSALTLPPIIALLLVPKLRARARTALTYSPTEVSWSCFIARLPPGVDRRKPAPAPAPRPVRSKFSVARATVQPPLSWPMRWFAGTRAPVMKTSLNPDSPVIWISGRTSTPGWSMLNAK